MINNDDDIKRLLNEFDLLESAFIDASSIIYFHKIGAIEILQKNIKLFTIKEILSEIKPYKIQIEIRNLQFYQSRLNDLKLLETAYESKIPVISDDKKILINAGSKGLKYYNSLIILNFLMYKKALDRSEYSSYKSNLLKIAWYSDKIIDFCEKLNAEIIKHA